MNSNHQECNSILIFKTNLNNTKDVTRISLMLNTENRVIRWNVDLSDIDNVLRIESNQLQPIQIIQLMATAGYNCEELKD